MGMDNMKEKKDSEKPDPFVPFDPLKVFGVLSLIALPMQYYYDLPGDLKNGPTRYIIYKKCFSKIIRQRVRVTLPH